ncbi:hypothetical protein AALT_g4450 [Alternaria alternata]|nr:hypothetical protein AALT_g4450 [Alternaria alternata]
MAPNPDILYNPSDHGEPNSMLPEEVIGHIDLGTLTDIHRYLCESELQEDIELAAWMWENYLDGLQNGSSTAEIRTAQAFGKLDRAYRRVRSLTNKAQDKWPFFDRNFKEMSSATVRNNARGEAAPGIIYPIDGLQRKSHLTGLSSNGSTKSNVSSRPELQAPFDFTTPARYQSQFQDHLHSTSVPLPSNLSARSSDPPNSETQHVALEHPSSSVAPFQNTQESRAQGSFPASDGQAKPQSESLRPDVPQIEEAFDHDMPQDKLGASLSAPVGDAMLRHSDSQPTGDLEPEAPRRYYPRIKEDKEAKKGGKIQSSISNLNKRESSVPKVISQEPEAAPAEGEGPFADTQSSSPAVLSQEAEGQHEVQEEASVSLASHALVPPTAVDEPEAKEEKAAPHHGPISAYLLAAEAEAVPSNLDRLPPNSRKSNKRKSEPTVQSGDRKRGKHGGIVGRPRKSEQRKGQESQHDTASPQGETAIDAEDPPQMTTRRATRQTAAANLGTLTSSKPTANIQPDVPVERFTHSSKKSQKLPQNQEKLSTSNGDTEMGEVQENAPATQEKMSEMPSLPPRTSDNHLLSFGMGRIISSVLPQPSSRPQAYQSPYQPIPSPPPSASVADETMNKSAKSVNLPGQVEYFARITTGNGDSMDLPIEEDRLESDEVKMIKRYAKYNAGPGVGQVSYTQFRQIYAFAKQD